MGVQRQDRMLVRVFHDGTVRPEECVLRLVFTDGKLSSIKATSDAGKAALDAVEVELRQHRRGAGVPTGGAFDFVVPLRTDKLIRMAVVKRTVDGKTDQVPWAKALGFAHRIPQDAEEFRNNLTFKRRRHQDQETVQGASVDVLRAYLGTPQAETLAPYLINAFVIATYKSVAVNVRHSGLEYKAQVEALTDQLQPASSMRLDRDVARLSIHTALWHYAAHVGDEALFEESMRGIVELSRLERQHHPTFAYNATKSLLLYALIVSFDEPRRAIRLFELIYDRFQKAAAVRTSNPTWLQELSVALEASIVALGAVRFLKAKTALTIGQIRMILEMCSRIDTPVFRKRLKAMVGARRAAGTAKLRSVDKPRGKTAPSPDEADEDDEG